MALPKQVEQQLREVEEIEKQLYPQAGEAEPTPSPVVETAVPEVAPTDETPPQSNVVELKPETDWEHKYRTLQGMFDKQVPQLHQQNKELVANLQTLQEQVTALQQKPHAEPAQERFVTEADETAFGADLIDVQRRVAKEVMREMVTPLQNELKLRDAKIAQLEQTVSKTDGEVNTMSFEQQLNRAVPDFEAINNDPKWVSWLNEIDAFTGEPRRSYAEYVYNQGNVAKLKEVVKFYKDSTGQDQQQAQREQRQTELNRQVAPTRTATSSSTATPSERVYTEIEMGRLFDKVGQLNRQGKYDEATKLEADLSNAYVQGRVRG